MLLSRTANDLYWLGRHLERAEGLARITAAHTDLMVDLPVDVESDWSTLLAITGSRRPFVDRYDGTSEAEIMTFLLADIGNPTSLVRTVSSARENLRLTRSLLPRSAWETMNRVHLETVRRSPDAASRTDRRLLLDEVVSTCQRLSGIMDGTMSRDQAWRFCELGRQVERADLTTRVLDVRAGALIAAGSRSSQPPADRSPYEDVRWLGVLRCLDAHHSFERATRSGVEPDHVVRFLLDDEGCPRSVRHCIDRMEALLLELPTRPTLLGACDGLRAVCANRPTSSMSARQLHQHMDRVQVGLTALHHTVAAAFFTRRDQPARATTR